MSELETWFEKWWKDLPKHHFTSTNKGSRAECLAEVKKLNPDKELQDKITWYTRERTLRYAKMRDSHTLPGWKHACRLIKYRFWEDDLPNSGDSDAQRVSNACACGKPTEILDKCGECYDKTSQHYAKQKELLREGWKKTGIPKCATAAEQAIACRDWLLKRGGVAGSIAARARIPA